jgi:predicted pyridoxine 5'-phosphate oxidase superfamily flavin-nucleotide-binding protein
MNYSREYSGRYASCPVEVNKIPSLTEEMKEVFAKNKIFSFATASKNGIPNVAPLASVQLAADDTIWIGDNYMFKTLANVRENPHGALYIWDPEKKRCFQIKGTVMVKTSGPEYEKIKAQIKAKGPHYPAKGLLILKITEVYECTPGPGAGKKVE